MRRKKLKQQLEDDIRILGILSHFQSAVRKSNNTTYPQAMNKVLAKIVDSGRVQAGTSVLLMVLIDFESSFRGEDFWNDVLDKIIKMELDRENMDNKIWNENLKCLP